MPTIIVTHRGYGCDTGCCGHVVEVDGKKVGDFQFTHPGLGQSTSDFVRELVTNQLGEEHCQNIDWDNCLVLND